MKKEQAKKIVENFIRKEVRKNLNESPLNSRVGRKIPFATFIEEEYGDKIYKLLTEILKSAYDRALTPDAETLRTDVLNLISNYIDNIASE